MDQGFVDLSNDGDSAKVDESFWPSFTDIMMVVVMIFMLASTVLVLRNWELVEELRNTIDAERRAEERARSVTEAKATVEEQLAQLQSQLSETRMDLMRANEDNQQKSSTLARQQERIVAQEVENRRLNAELQATTQRMSDVSEQLRQREADYQRLSQDYTSQEQRLTSTQQQLADAMQSNREQAAQLGELQQAQARADMKLKSLQGEYTTLKGKYDKLVRPARTAVGKEVVEVRYEKQGGAYHIQLRLPGESDYRVVDQAALEKQLAQLKKRHPQQLYVKIVIPEDSGLSYSEAWTFTRDVLDKYDYYYQQ